MSGLFFIHHSLVENAAMIPLMNHPLARYWDQPAREAIELDDKFAWMSLATFNELREYSCSYPSGVYPGKMWRRHEGLYEFGCPVSRRRWLLCWYGEVANGQCEICFREIRLA